MKEGLSSKLGQGLEGMRVLCLLLTFLECMRSMCYITINLLVGTTTGGWLCTPLPGVVLEDRSNSRVETVVVVRNIESKAK